MRLGPGVPVDSESVTGVGLDGLGVGLGRLVAVDVGRAERGGLDKAVVLVQGLPASSGRSGALGVEPEYPDIRIARRQCIRSCDLPVGVLALSPDTVVLGSSDVAVTVDDTDEGRRHNGESSGGNHVDWEKR